MAVAAPLSRTLLETIAAAQPRRVFIDVDFSAHTNAEDDGLLEAALAAVRAVADRPAGVLSAGRRRAGKMVYTRPLERLRAPRDARRRELPAGQRRPDSLDGARPGRSATRRFPRRSQCSPAPDRSRDGEVPIDYSISPASFTYVSYVDVLAGRVDPDGAARQDRDDRADRAGAQRHHGRARVPGAARRRGAGAGRADRARGRAACGAALAGSARARTAHGACRRLFRAQRAGAAISLVGAAAIAAARRAATCTPTRPIALVLELVPRAAGRRRLFLAATIRSLDHETMRSLAYALGMRRRDALLGSVAESSTDGIMVVGRHGPDRDGQRRRGIDVRVPAAKRWSARWFHATCRCRMPAIVPATLPGKVIEQEATQERRHAVPGRDLRQPRGRPGRSAAHGHRARHHARASAAAARCSTRRRTIR